MVLTSCRTLDIGPSAPRLCPALRLPPVDEMQRQAHQDAAEGPDPKPTRAAETFRDGHEYNPFRYPEPKRLGVARERDLQLFPDHVQHQRLETGREQVA